MNARPPLTDFQVQVVRLFFTLPEAEGFLLAGGAALAAVGLTDRPTQDLDLFTAGTTVSLARDALVRALDAHGWTTRLIQDTPTFCRLVVRGPQDLLVDLARDSGPRQPATVTFAGPTFAPEELAARKLLALFDRAAARDFADVFTLAATFTPQTMLELAADIDPGLDRHVLADMLDAVSRFADVELPVTADRVAPLRAFFASWAVDLRR